MKNIYLLFLLVIISGCAIFKGNNIPSVQNNLETLTDKRVKIYTKWDFDFYPIEYGSLTYKDREQVFSRVLKEFDYFEVVNQKSEADIILQGRAYEKRNPKKMTIGLIISALSLHIIPSWYKTQIFFSANVGVNNQITHYQVDDSIIVARWAPLIICTPFAYNIDKTQTEIMENAYRALLSQIKNDSLQKI